MIYAISLFVLYSVAFGDVLQLTWRQWKQWVRQSTTLGGTNKTTAIYSGHINQQIFCNSAELCPLLVQCIYIDYSYQVESGHWECVTVLIESGACVDACDPVGRSVLYVGSQRGHARCVELLLGQSASCLLTENCSKWGPLHVAGTEYMYVWISLWNLSLCGSLTHPCVCLLTAANGHSECLRMLLCSEGGADLVNVTDAEGQYVWAHGSFTLSLYLF